MELVCIAVCVIDPGSHFMQSWNNRFAALEISHLRSPSFAHPAAFEPKALVEFAIREGRTSELTDAPVCCWVPTTDLSPQGSLLKALPSNALFRDFCLSLEATLPHRWLSGTANSVCKDPSTGEFRVHYTAKPGERERTVVARAVILATGPVGKWNVPAPFGELLASQLVLHTEELLVENRTLREEITRRCPGEPGRVLVIGGGLSAAQAALAAFRAGHHVVLRSRRPLQTRAFDIASDWLDVRHADRLRYEFLSLPIKRRRDAVREAASGGSVPATYLEEIHRLAQSSSALQLEIDEEIDRSQVCMGPGGELVVVNGDSFAIVILATGVVAETSCSPLYLSVQELFEAPTIDGLPHVDNSLRWMPGEDLFVLGANAVLELGPGGGNLLGAMRGARVVSNELCSLMRKQSGGKSARPARSIFANKYAGVLDGSEPEIDVLVERLHLSAKAETALKKASKHRTTKGAPGIILPHGGPAPFRRPRRDQRYQVG